LRGEGKSVANFAIILYIEQHNCEQNLYTSSEGGSFSILSTQMKRSRLDPGLILQKPFR
jgi:hypothetical protein